MPKKLSGDAGERHEGKELLEVRRAHEQKEGCKSGMEMTGENISNFKNRTYSRQYLPVLTNRFIKTMLSLII